MEEHFNENYLESTKYPKSTFKGQIENPSAIQWTKPGTYKTQIKGKLTLHGVTKDISVPGEFTVSAAGIQGKSNFKVKCEDYGIKIPSLVRDKIAQEINISVNSNYQAFNK
jgi:polyisoprenoid-binding protein YceI